jgi:hypothetical protein
MLKALKSGRASRSSLVRFVPKTQETSGEQLAIENRPILGMPPAITNGDLLHDRPFGGIISTLRALQTLHNWCGR